MERIDSIGEGTFADHGQLYRTQAFQAAGKHSVRVRLLKRAMVAGSAGAVVLVIGIGVFDPMRRLASAFSFEGVELTGAKIAMSKPHVSGFREDGRPYEIHAAAMTQDLRKPTAFDLTAVDGTIGLADKGTAKITAKTGYYDNAANSMDLSGDVHVKNDSGYEAFLDVAHVDFKSGSVVSDKPVKVFMNTTSVTADGMNVSDNGKTIVFSGHVKSTMNAQQAAVDTTASLKRSTP